MKKDTIHRLFDFPKNSFFLYGPRGTGKSTLIRDQGPKDAYQINLLMEDQYQNYLVDPKIFYQELQALQNGSWVVMDEVQRLPGLLNYVHLLIEEKKLKFILSGSSARKLKNVSSNLLGGRAYTKWMHPFLPQELGKQFQLKRSLETGLIPLIYMDENSQDRLSTYVQTYLKEEIHAEALVRNLPGFSRFLSVASLSHGQIMNMTNIASDAGVARTTVQGFYEILVDTLIGFFLHSFDSRLKVREVQKPKFYFVDPGIVRGIKKRKGIVTNEEKGVLFEGLIAQLLRGYQSYREIYDDIFYWHLHGRVETEVDFVLKRGKEIIAIEVKAKNKIKSSDLKGLLTFSEINHVDQKIVIYLGDKKMKIQDVTIYPFESFIEEIEKW